MAIPWALLGEKPSLNTRMGMNAGLINDDYGGVQQIIVKPFKHRKQAIYLDGYEIKMTVGFALLIFFLKTYFESTLLSVEEVAQLED